MAENNINNQPSIDNDQEIDIIELLSKLWKKRKMIIKWCIVGAILGLIIGFSIPETYNASVTLAPELEQKAGSNVSSIASMMGVNLNNSIDAINAEMFPDVVHSTPFIVELFDLPVTFERKGEMITTSLLDYMKNYQRSAWWSYIPQIPGKILGLFSKKEETNVDIAALNPNNLPKKERGVVGFFAENIIVSVDIKSLKTTISLDLQDPQVVYVVVNAVVDNLKEYMSDYRSSKARQDVENLSVICEQRKADYYKAQQAYARHMDSNKSVILQSAQAEQERLQQEMNLAYQVYSQVAQQLEGARITEQQAKPVFAIVQPPVIPLHKVAPSKAKLLIVFTLLAGCCAAIWILFGEDLFEKFKQTL